MGALAASATGVDRGVATRIGTALAAEAPGDAPPGVRLSGLNYDGTPLQLCITIARGQAASRVLADPAAGERELERRYERGLLALDSAPARGSDADADRLCDRLLAALVPDAAAVLARPDGVLWLGAGLSHAGLAAYVDARPAGVDGLRRWLESEVGDASGVRVLLQALAHGAAIQSAGVETAASGARLKVYWRLTGGQRLYQAGLPGLTDRRFAEFARLALAPRGRMRRTGVVLSAGVRASDGMLSDVKLDLCGCPGCLALSAAQWSEVLGEVATRNAIALPPLDALLARAEVAFVGFGLNAAGEPRLNLYFKERR